MSTEQFTQLKNEIVTRITNNFNVKEIILFGSYAYGEPTKDSDVDLVVIINEHGFDKNFEEKFNRRLNVSHLLLDIKKETPVDMLVYTIDEWNTLLEMDSSFIRDINKFGVRLV